MLRKEFFSFCGILIHFPQKSIRYKFINRAFIENKLGFSESCFLLSDLKKEFMKLEWKLNFRFSFLCTTLRLGHQIKVKNARVPLTFFQPRWSLNGPFFNG